MNKKWFRKLLLLIFLLTSINVQSMEKQEKTTNDKDNIGPFKFLTELESKLAILYIQFSQNGKLIAIEYMDKKGMESILGSSFRAIAFVIIFVVLAMIFQTIFGLGGEGTFAIFAALSQFQLIILLVSVFLVDALIIIIYRRKHVGIYDRRPGR